MRVRVVACAPCLAADGLPIDLGAARLITLDFDAWMDLEGQSRSGAYDKLRRRYEVEPPVFWEGWIEADAALVAPLNGASAGALHPLVAPQIEAFVRALHWYSGTPPKLPRDSVIYFDPRGRENEAAMPGIVATIAERGAPRLYGPSDKEYVRRNDHPTIALGHADLEAFRAMHDFVLATQAVWSDEVYELAAESLTLCAMEGLDWPSQVLLIVGACEALFSPDVTTELQKTFERRFSALAARRSDDVADYAAWLRLGYRLRSDLIHGRSQEATLKRLPRPPDEYVAILGRMGVAALCRLIGYRHAAPPAEPASDPLWPRIDGAAPDAAAVAAWPDVNPTPRHQWEPA